MSLPAASGGWRVGIIGESRTAAGSAREPWAARAKARTSWKAATPAPAVAAPSLAADAAGTADTRLAAALSRHSARNGGTRRTAAWGLLLRLIDEGPLV